MFRLLGLWIALLAAAVSVSPMVNVFWASALLAIAAITLSAVALPHEATTISCGRSEVWLGLTAALVVTTWFRLCYWQTVPAGYLGEVLNFVNFAEYLRARGFPYEPYAWYAHTLFSYVIATVRIFVHDPLTALRVAQILISLATATAVAWCAWVLFGARAAWITTALVATSWWHVWATRNGYHQFLTPFFQAIAVGGLVKGLRDKDRYGFWIAAVGIAGGLHAYWALYLLPPFAALLMLFFAWTHPKEWQEVRRPAIGAAILTVLLSLPAIVAVARAPEGLSYVSAGLRPVRVGAETLLEKLLHNAAFLGKALFSAGGNANVPPAVLDYLLRGGALLGFGIILRRARREVSSLTLLVLFAVNLLGLLIAIANEFYVIAIFLPLFLFAGTGFATLLSVSQQRARFLGWATLALFILAWGYFGFASVERFFRIWAYTMFRSPRHPQGLAFLLLPHWQSCIRDGTCAVPAGEPGRDFEEEALLLGVHLPSYRWLHGLGRVYSDSILFAPVQFIPGQPLRLIVPPSIHIEQRLLPSWQALYPGTTRSELFAPPPWNDPEPTLLALDIRIPSTALQRRIASSDRLFFTDALFWAPEPGLYEFRRLVPGDAPATLHQSVPLSGLLYLDRGYHPVELPWQGWSWTGWQVRRFGLGWEALDHYLIAVTEAEANSLLRSHLAPPAHQAVFEWSVNRTVPLPGQIWDMAFCPDHNLFVLIGQHLYRIDVVSGHTTALTTVVAPDPSLRCTADGVDIVGRDGNWHRWKDDELLAVFPLPCAVKQIAKSSGPLTALCGDARLWLETGEEIFLLDRFGRPLPRPVAVERCHNRIYVLDATLAELLSYSPTGQLLSSKAVPHVWWESELNCDGDQNLYILQWKRGRPVYSPAGALLYHPHSKAPWVFTREGKPFHGFGFRRFVINGDLAAWTRDNEIEVLRRIELDVHAREVYAGSP